MRLLLYSSANRRNDQMLLSDATLLLAPTPALVHVYGAARDARK